MNDKQLMVRVITFKDGEEELSRDIDYNDPLHRKWLGSHSYWAISTGRTVEVGKVEHME